METNFAGALDYLLHNTDMLSHFGYMFAAAILIGALVLNFTNYWRWVLAFAVFVILLQVQVNSLAINQGAPGGTSHIIMLNIIRAASALAFVGGATLGILLKMKWSNYYTRVIDGDIDKVSTDIIKKVSVNSAKEA